MPLLSWHNRDEALTRAARAPYRLLEPVAGLSYGDADAPNLLIEGDNLDALKALLPYYAGQVKCIFIDPPYNTRSAFEHYDDNLEHSQWLSMIYPRLELLREFLTEDGSLWVTLDDNEAHYFKVICDEIFGRGNFISNVIWQKKFSPQNDAKWISNSHDHLFCYAKNKDSWFPTPLPRTAEMDERYKNPDNDPKGLWASTDLTRAEHRDRDYWGLVTPSGKEIFPARGRSWSRPKENIEKLKTEGRLWFGPEGDRMPRLKKYLAEMDGGLTPQSIWFHQEVGNNQEAKREILNLGFETVFDTPKPERLIQRALHLSSKPGDLVLDSVLGSGTTAAVAHKMGRRWIGIELGEHARTYCQPRLKKVVDGERGGISEAVGWQGGGGFRYYKLGAPVFDENGRIRADIRFEQLAAHVWFTETGVARSTRAKKEAFLGEHGGTGYYLLFNGILGDDSKSGGNVLTRRVLRTLPAFDGPKVIYGEACNLPDEQLREQDIAFRQTPYDIKAR